MLREEPFELQHNQGEGPAHYACRARANFAMRFRDIRRPRQVPFRPVARLRPIWNSPGSPQESTKTYFDVAGNAVVKIPLSVASTAPAGAQRLLDQVLA
jgi:hypothetical protein